MIHRGTNRRIVALLALFASLAVGVAPHRHAGIETFLEGTAGSGLTHEIICPNPTALHWHRDRIFGPDACLACLRHRLSTSHAILAASAPQLAAEAAPSNRPIPKANFEARLHANRGPPSSLLAI
jgi:hypothetical protein